MKKIVMLLFLIGQLPLAAQVNKDLDSDGIADIVVFDTIRSKIVCKLSTKKFVPIQSQEFLTIGHIAGILPTKSGFEFYWGHAQGGFAAQFRYDPKAKGMQLIGMSSYERGPQSKDEVATSSVNLLTNDFIGEMSEYDEDKKQLVAIPTIKAKMSFQKMYLETFGEVVSDDFFEQSNEAFNQRDAQ